MMITHSVTKGLASLSLVVLAAVHLACSSDAASPGGGAGNSSGGSSASGGSAGSAVGGNPGGGGAGASGSAGASGGAGSGASGSSAAGGTGVSCSPSEDPSDSGVCLDDTNTSYSKLKTPMTAGGIYAVSIAVTKGDITAEVRGAEDKCGTGGELLATKQMSPGTYCLTLKPTAAHGFLLITVSGSESRSYVPTLCPTGTCPN